MAGSNYLLDYWNAQSLVFTENLDSIRRKPVKKAVHDIRVAIKKLKSTLHLANQVAEDRELLKMDSIQRFFRISGKYRDVDVSLSLLRKTCKEEAVSIPSMKKNLHAMLAMTRNTTHEAAGWPHESELGSLTSGIQLSLTGITNEMLNKKTEDLAARTLDEVKSLSQNLSHHAHPVRKKLKELYYWLSQCTANPFFDKKQMKIFDKALSALGHWHDYFVFKIKLKKFRKEYLVKGTAEYDQSRKTEDITELLMEQWLANAGNKIHTLLKPV